MELWNIITTFVTVGVIVFGAYYTGYTVRDMEAKQSRKKTLKRG
ncbi:unnamed protein product [Fructobacillus fructosus]|uniref:Uncharacterized protein n=1 Tax=Fructobacillus fructosus TaxID=1631 RepID=A0ABN9YYP5_9LACO|nr:unnamed protein product [Fructobacillus fructosus]